MVEIQDEVAVLPLLHFGVFIDVDIEAISESIGFA